MKRYLIIADLIDVDDSGPKITIDRPVFDALGEHYLRR